MDIQQFVTPAYLEPGTTLSDIEGVCRKSVSGNHASVCVPPSFVKKAKELLTGSNIKTATVVGFPFGYSAIEAKLSEIVLAIIDGVDEICITSNLSAIKNSDYAFIGNEIGTILPIVKNKSKLLKVIIESEVLTEEELIRCCDIYGAAGINALITSTGFGKSPQTIHTIARIKKHLADAVSIEVGYGNYSELEIRQFIEVGVERVYCKGYEVFS